MVDSRNINLSCSFCGKSQREVRKLIAGPTVYICDECVGLCHAIIAEEMKKDEARAGAEEIPGENSSPEPHETPDTSESPSAAPEPAVCFSGVVRGYSDEQLVLKALTG